MTGRELIIYILENNLENEPILKDGKFVGFLTAVEVAEKMDVGVATIFTWWSHGMLDGVVFGGRLYIPVNFTHPAMGDDKNI